MNATKGKRQYVKNKKGYYEFKCNFCNKLFIARGDFNPISCGCQSNKYSSREHEIKHVTLLEKIKNGITKVKVKCNNCNNIWFSSDSVEFKPFFDCYDCYNCYWSKVRWLIIKVYVCFRSSNNF